LVVVEVDEMKFVCKLKLQTMTKKMVKLTSAEIWLNSSASNWLSLLQQESV
jgi:hypothetical protein